MEIGSKVQLFSTPPDGVYSRVQQQFEKGDRKVSVASYVV